MNKVLIFCLLFCKLIESNNYKIRKFLLESKNLSKEIQINSDLGDIYGSNIQKEIVIVIFN